MPYRFPRFRARTHDDQNQRSEPDVSWRLARLFDLPRRFPQRTTGTNLPVLSQLCRLEADQCGTVRSLEDALSPDRLTRSGPVREVPREWTKRKAPVRRDSFQPVL